MVQVFNILKFWNSYNKQTNNLSGSEDIFCLSAQGLKKGRESLFWTIIVFFLKHYLDEIQTKASNQLNLNLFKPSTLKKFLFSVSLAFKALTKVSSPNDVLHLLLHDHRVPAGLCDLQLLAAGGRRPLETGFNRIQMVLAGRSWHARLCSSARCSDFTNVALRFLNVVVNI